jgi:hypothetical protein
MDNRKPEKIGWTEIGLILVLILEIAIFILAILGPSLGNIIQ